MHIVSELFEVQRKGNFHDINKGFTQVNFKGGECCAVSSLRPAHLSPWIWLIKLEMPFDH